MPNSSRGTAGCASGTGSTNGAGVSCAVPWAGGAVLMLCVAAAMLLANLPSTAMYYEHVLSTDLSLLIESPDHVVDLVFPRDMNVEKLINDGLMVIFFFVVGLEIKREIVAVNFRRRARRSCRSWPRRAVCSRRR